MELKNLISQENSNEGVWFRAVLYHKKQPFEIKILGEDSDEVQQYNRDRLRNLKVGRNGVEFDAEVLEELAENKDENVLIRMCGLRSIDDTPLTLNGKELKSDRESYRALIEAIPEVKDFVLKMSEERTNFLQNGKKN